VDQQADLVSQLSLTIDITKLTMPAYCI